MADSVTERRKEPYLGEKRNYLRDGYGTYVYENQFFRYEGEWVKGKKHGHGKLLMKDGTFYEGQFTDGEITGNGYKHFASSNAKYTGEFLCGEMHGNGMMVYRDGSIYKGQWYKNRRQGFGTLWTQKKAVYEGTFYEDMRDGEGKQTYDASYQNLSNGDKYEGHWVQDRRNGHGQLSCADGSSYEGNFVNDLFHGEGKMLHVSGMYYRGLWINGYPEKMATKIVLMCDSPLEIEQGQLFSIRVECRNDEDELVAEQGRELQLLAGFKFTPPEESSALFDMIEDYKEQPIHTPFGYDVVSYPLTDQLPEIEVTTKIEEVEEQATEEDASEFKLADATKALEGASSQEISEEIQKVDSDTVLDEKAQQSEISLDSTTENKEESENKIEELSQMAAQVQNKLTTNGICEWSHLQLAPPPPMYRPFVILKKEEEARKRSKFSKEKLETSEEIAEEIELQEITESELGESKEEEDNSEDRTIPKEPSENIQSFTTNSMRESDASNNNDLQEFNVGFSNEEIHESDLGSQHTSISEEKRNSQQPGGLPKEEKEFYETIARPGEYVIIVREVTSPPFLGKILEPAYLLLQLKKPKKSFTRKPNSQGNFDEDIHEDDDGTHKNS